MALSKITDNSLNITDLTIADDLTVTDDLLLASDGAIIKFGADADVTLTHVHDTGLTLNTALTATALTASGDVSLDGGSFVFNESSADKDFRIESNGESHMFFVDGGNDIIGMGVSNPTDYNSYGNGLVISRSETTGSSGITLVSATDGYGSIYFSDATGNVTHGAIEYGHGANLLKLKTNGSSRLELDSTGNLGVGRAVNAHSGYNNIAIGGSGSTTGSMIELFDSDGNRDGKAYANAGDLYVAAESNNLYLNTNGTNGIRVENDGQVTISRFNESAGNNHAHLTLSYNLSTSIGGFAMYTYSYYSDVNWRLTNNDTHGGRNHNDMAFIRSGSTVGSVSVGTSGTSFNTSSDYRLKEDHKSITDAIGTVKQLKPINFKWKKTGVRQDGFIAHEVDEILDYAVTGKKDAVKTHENVVLDKDGFMVASDITKEKFEERIIDSDNEDQSPIGETTYPEGSTWKATHEDIDPQVMDNAKLVPILTAALQEAIARIEALESK